jgi:arginyl-tRNA synthetase
MSEYVLNALKSLLSQAVSTLIERRAPGTPTPELLGWEPPKNPEYGDLSTNAAMTLAKPLRTNPLVLAEELLTLLPSSPWIERYSVSKPGFVNLVLSREALGRMLTEPLEAGRRFGHTDSEAGKSVLLEFVSANPTGPMHVGHARHAAVGDSLARILAAAGWKVHCEFYVNDAGNQVETLGISLRTRVLQLLGDETPLPADGYPGDYLLWYAWEFLKTEHPHPAQGIDDNDLLGGRDAEEFSTTPADAAGEADPTAETEAPDAAGGREKAQREWIARATERLIAERGADAIGRAREQIAAMPSADFAAFAKERILTMIQKTLGDLRVHFDRYFPESSLYKAKATETTLEELRAAGAVFEQEGALWLRSTEKGDDKDRVLIKGDGRYTYLVPDIAYHHDKFRRRGGVFGDGGPDLLVNLFGSDHDGYPPRLKAALAFLGHDPERLRILLMRLVFLMRDGKRLDMGKRSGNFVSARDLLGEVGCDVLRFFLLQRSVNSEINFDLNLAREHSDRNPVFKIQYAHARVCSLFRKAAEKGIEWRGPNSGDIRHLVTAEEKDIIRAVADLPETVRKAAVLLEPHHLTAYLLALAELFNHYWSQAKTDPEYRMIVPEAPERTQARLSLAAAIRVALASGLDLLGVEAPERMDREEEDNS